MKYICDCMKGKNNEKLKHGRGIWDFTEVDADEICVHCGHYAMAFREVDRDGRGRISPTVQLTKLYGVEAQETKRKKLIDLPSLTDKEFMDFIKSWKFGKTFDEQNATWFHKVRNKPEKDGGYIPRPNECELKPNAKRYEDI